MLFLHQLLIQELCFPIYVQMGFQNLYCELRFCCRVFFYFFYYFCLLFYPCFANNHQIAHACSCFLILLCLQYLIFRYVLSGCFADKVSLRYSALHSFLKCSGNYLILGEYLVVSNQTNSLRVCNVFCGLISLVYVLHSSYFDMHLSRTYSSSVKCIWLKYRILGWASC